MSIEAIAWAMRQQVRTPYHRLALIAMADNSDVDAFVDMTWQTLVDFTLVPSGAVRLAVEDMDGRLLTVEQQQDRLVAQLLVEMRPGFVWRPRRRAVPEALRVAVMLRDGHRCVYCGSSDSLTIDHVVPVIAGGSNDYDNLATCCAPCNSSKGAKPLADWMAERRSWLATR